MGIARKHRRVQLLREDLPYGVWLFEDGTAQLFNRRYEAITSRKRVRPETWTVPLTRRALSVAHSAQRNGEPRALWFYDDATSPWVNRSVLNACKEILERW